MSVDKVSRLITEAQNELFGWVPLTFWLDMKKGEGENYRKIRYRVSSGMWVEGVHIARAGRKEAWVNLRNIKAWLEGTQLEQVPPPAEKEIK